MARKHRLETFSLSFLDIMACGFGAVVLFFMIINHRIDMRSQERNTDLLSEVSRLEQLVREGERNLVMLRNTIENTDQQFVVTQGLSARVIQTLSVTREELSEMQNLTKAERERIEQLKSDIQKTQKETERLAADNEEQNAVRTFIGTGDRQYLTGLRVGGDRILMLIDSSASMLAESIVNVIRRRNMADEQKIASHKWQRAVRTAEWLTAQLPPTSQFQIYSFSTEARPLVAGTDGQWLSIGDGETLNQAIDNLHRLVPGDGTSLYNVFEVAARMQPPPDNIYLITDGLPTQGRSKPLKNTVSGEARERHFERAVKLLPEKVPVNVILFPIEGDPAAASHYWRMVNARGGTLISPARDWP